MTFWYCNYFLMIIDFYMNRLKIIKNCIKCNSCGDVIESFSRHDFKYCSCHRVAVDGGLDYLRRCFTDVLMTMKSCLLQKMIQKMMIIQHKFDLI